MAHADIPLPKKFCPDGSPKITIWPSGFSSAGQLSTSIIVIDCRPGVTLVIKRNDKSARVAYPEELDPSQNN